MTLLVIFCISAVFWMAWFQEFYTFSFWARDHTGDDRPARALPVH